MNVTCVQPPMGLVSSYPIVGVGGLADTRINCTAFKRPGLTSCKGYQFTSFYNATGHLTISRRSLGAGGGWTTFPTGFSPNTLNDPHCVSVVAVDGDGFLHVAWGVHGHELRYTRSTSPVTSETEIVLNGRVSADGVHETLAAEVPLHDRPVTYPEFTTLPDGDLLLQFRTGRSGAGDYHLLRWALAEQRWVAVSAAVDGDTPWFSASAPAGAEIGSAYPSNLVVDAEGCIHVAWTWRAKRGPGNPFTDYQRNSGVFYARSLPLSGQPAPLRWVDSAGQLYGRNARHAIDQGNAVSVVPIARGESLINTWSLALDGDGQPGIALWYAPNAGKGDHTRQFALARRTGAGWSMHQIGTRLPEYDGRVPESLLGTLTMSRPIVLYRGSATIVIFCDHQRNRSISAAIALAGSPSNWVFVAITTADAGLWEPSYDVERWRAAGIISMLYQAVGIGAAVSPLSVIEIDADALVQLAARHAERDDYAVRDWRTGKGWYARWGSNPRPSD
ncbi:MAG: neuraminidase [Devosia sp.]|nr:neuraminidase [Devosia sp.]